MTSNNPFKSDVFSFGLVVLYMVTHKKFKSHERLEVEEPSYKEILQEWIKEAKEICDGDSALTEILKRALDFDEFKRPLFKELKFMFFNERKKEYITKEALISKLEKEEEARVMKMQETSYFHSQPSNQLSLFKSRKFERIGFTKTISNGNAFKISKSNRNGSPSPVKRTTSLASSPSPERTEKSINSMQEIPTEYRKVIHLCEEYKFYL